MSLIWDGKKERRCLFLLPSAVDGKSAVLAAVYFGVLWRVIICGASVRESEMVDISWT